MEEAKGVLGGLVKGHLVLVLASLLSESTNTFVNPLVAVDLGFLRRHGGGGDDAVDLLLRKGVSRAVFHDRGKVMEK